MFIECVHGYEDSNGICTTSDKKKTCLVYANALMRGGRAKKSPLERARGKFKKGDVVSHIRGGRGEVRDLQNDWSTSPPTVVATVAVLDTIFHDIRRIPVTDLRKE